MTLYYLEGFHRKRSVRLWISRWNDQKQTFTRKRVFEGDSYLKEEKRPATEKNSKRSKRITEGENVMLENKWNNIAPEVPQDFHDKFEETLRQIEQADPVDKNTKEKESAADY